MEGFYKLVLVDSEAHSEAIGPLLFTRNPILFTVALNEAVFAERLTRVRKPCKHFSDSGL